MTGNIDSPGHTITAPELLCIQFINLLLQVSVNRLTIIGYKKFKYKKEKCYRGGFLFTINTLKYIEYYTQKRNNKDTKYTIYNNVIRIYKLIVQISGVVF